MRSEITVGRRPGNTIRLTERNVSRVHARIVQQGEGYTVEDLSRWGTRLNGEKIHGSANLRVGDSLTIGDYILTLEADVAAAAPPPMGSDWSSGGTDHDAFDDHDEPARLAILSGPRRGETFSLSGGQTFTVGRSRHADFVLDDASVSKLHIQLEPEDDGYAVLDLNSANGIELNGRPVTRAKLNQGDQISIGQFALQYLPPGATFVLAAAPAPKLAPAYDAAELDELRGKNTKSALLGALGGALAVLLLIGGGLLIFQRGGSDPAEQDVPGHREPAPAPDSGRSPASDALARGQSALGEMEWERAIAAFDEAIAGFEEAEDSRSLETAQSLRGRAESGLEHREIYEEIRALAEAGEYASALQKFPEIPVGSAYRTLLSDDDMGRRIVESYVDEVVEASDVAAGQRQFQEALAMISEAQNLADSHPRLAQQRDRIISMDSRRGGQQNRPAQQPREQRPQAQPVRQPAAAASAPAQRAAPEAPEPRNAPAEVVAQPTVQVTPPPAQQLPPSPEERAARVAELKSQARTLGLRQRDYAGAVRALEEARRMDPTDAEVNLMLYSNYQNWGRNRDAARAVERYLRQRPSDPRRETLEAFLNEHKDW